jgi:hypothetical protein
MRTMLLSLIGFLVWSVLPLAAQPPAPKPGPEHALLKDFEGDWEATVSYPGEESKGTATYRLGFGGFWLTEHFQGEFAGMKFEGRSTMGYDPIKKKYVSVWIDSAAPGLTLLEGTYDKATKTLTESGEGPNMEGRIEKMKNVYQIKDKDSFTFTMYQLQDGKEQQMMRISYKRRK